MTTALTLTTTDEDRTSWITCAGCGRLAHEPPGHDLCMSCLRRAQALKREQKGRHPGRRYVRCRHSKCETVIVDYRGRPVVGHEAEAALCMKHLLAVTIRRTEPGAPRPLAVPTLADVAECCNFVQRECLLQGDGRCAVIEGGFCSWYEQAIARAPHRNRLCTRCGRTVTGRRLVCDGCQRKRASERQREHRRRKVTVSRAQNAPQTV